MAILFIVHTGRQLSNWMTFLHPESNLDNQHFENF
jgi:hypothetical protein